MKASFFSMLVLFSIKAYSQDTLQPSVQDSNRFVSEITPFVMLRDGRVLEYDEITMNMMSHFVCTKGDTVDKYKYKQLTEVLIGSVDIISDIPFIYWTTERIKIPAFQSTGAYGGFGGIHSISARLGDNYLFTTGEYLSEYAGKPREVGFTLVVGDVAYDVSDLTDPMLDKIEEAFGDCPRIVNLFNGYRLVEGDKPRREYRILIHKRLNDIYFHYCYEPRRANGGESK